MEREGKEKIQVLNKQEHLIKVLRLLVYHTFDSISNSQYVELA